MKYLTDVTRQDIFDIIRDGFYIGFDEPVKDWETGQYEVGEDVKMKFYGRLSEIDFLQRLYRLYDMPSHDSRFTTAYDDIYRHTVLNDDWNEFWFFNDDRFQLSNSFDDEPLLKFICEMLHPAVRNENGPWKKYLEKFNELLRADGYELYEKNIISGRKSYDFRRLDFIEIKPAILTSLSELKLIGSGSYANVFKFYDQQYDNWFALKRAKEDLDKKEYERFHREFVDMKKLDSPYILKVYSYDNEKKQYIMELVGGSLSDYIDKNNTKITIVERKRLIMQLFNAFEYIHSNGLLHRDICPKNILIKKFSDTILLKVSDFGLVKEQDSDLTSDLSDIKGYCNDPSLKLEGFKNYSLLHEIYALTQVVIFIWTGKSNLYKIEDEKLKNFCEKGMNSDKSKRFQSLEEMKNEFFKIIG